MDYSNIINLLYLPVSALLERNGEPPMSDRVYIFDTTLRDGEQSPGCSMNTRDKLRMARQLVELGVDILEAGFPIASEGDFEATQAIAREFRWAQVAALARAVRLDVERALKALEAARRPRLHCFIATSEIHLKYKLKKTQEQVLEDAVKAVELARQYVDDVEFSAEDGSRTEPGFGSGAIIGRKLHVIHVLPRQLHRLYGVFQDLLLGLLQLVLEVNLAGRDEAVQPGPPRRLERLQRSLDIQPYCPCQRRHLRPAKLPGDGLSGLEVALGGDREAGFQDVHTQLDELARHAQLVAGVHAAPRRLLAIAQGRVEDVYAVAHGWFSVSFQ